MRLGYVILYVRDVAVSVAFFERAFGLKRGFAVPTGDYAEVVSGTDTVLGFATLELARSNCPPDGVAEAALTQSPAAVEIAFVVRDDEHVGETTESAPAAPEKGSGVLRAFSRALAAGAHKVAEPMRKPWGQMVGYVRTIDGHLVELCEPMGE